MAVRRLSFDEASYLPMFSGGNFMDDDTREPREGASCNVVFPASWGHWGAALWRRKHDCPGCGWTYEEGFKTCGIPTFGGTLLAYILNRLMPPTDRAGE